MPNLSRSTSTEAPPDHTPALADSFGPLARAAAVGAAAIGGILAPVSASEPQPPAPLVEKAVDPRSAAMAALDARVTIDTTSIRLDDLIGAMNALAQIKIEGVWGKSSDAGGLTRDLEVDFAARDMSVRRALEKLGEQLERDGIEATWQVLEDGRIQFGAKESLNRFQELKLYDVRDLLTELPNFTNAPDFDLNAALQQGRGGAGGGRIIGDPGADAPRKNARDLGERIKDIVMETVEPDQWIDAGGSGGSMRLYNDTLMVRAAPYIHRILSSSSR